MAEAHSIDAALRNQFGDEALLSPLATRQQMGRRIHHVDLSCRLSASQAELLQSLLDTYQVISFPDQDQHGVNVHDLERLANHFGAPIPHPSNFTNYGAPADDLKPRPADEQAVTRINAAFAGRSRASMGLTRSRPIP